MDCNGGFMILKCVWGLMAALGFWVMFTRGPEVLDSPEFKFASSKIAKTITSNIKDIETGMPKDVLQGLTNRAHESLNEQINKIPKQSDK